jgi:hypothetical protein
MRALLLICLASCAHAKNKTEKAAAVEAAKDAVKEIATLCQSAKMLAANITAISQSNIAAIEKVLDAAADHVDSDYESRRAGLEDKFSSLQETTEKEAQALSNPNSTTAHAVMAPLLDVSSKLDALDHEQRKALSHQLDDVIVEAAMPAEKALKQNKKAAHAAIDPLYGMGDATEDVADFLNDDLTGKFNCVIKANSKLSKHFLEYAMKIEHEGKEHLREAAHKRLVAVKQVQTSLGGAAMLINFAAQPARESPVTRANGVSSAWVVFFVSCIFGAMCASLIVKFVSSTSAKGTTTPLLHA